MHISSYVCLSLSSSAVNFPWLSGFTSQNLSLSTTYLSCTQSLTICFRSRPSNVFSELFKSTSNTILNATPKCQLTLASADATDRFAVCASRLDAPGSADRGQSTGCHRRSDGRCSAAACVGHCARAAVQDKVCLRPSAGGEVAAGCEAPSVFRLVLRQQCGGGRPSAVPIQTAEGKLSQVVCDPALLWMRCVCGVCE